MLSLQFRLIVLFFGSQKWEDRNYPLLPLCPQFFLLIPFSRSWKYLVVGSSEIDELFLSDKAKMGKIDYFSLPCFVVCLYYFLERCSKIKMEI